MISLHSFGSYYINESMTKFKSWSEVVFDSRAGFRSDFFFK